MASALAPPLPLERPALAPDRWELDPKIDFLNHGSFGSCPKAVLERQTEIRRRLEREPIDFFVRDLEGLLDEARGALAAFVGAHAADLVFAPNATTGVNAVLRSLQFKPEDELLTTNHEYNACRNALSFAAERAGARVRVAECPFPARSPEEWARPIMAAVTPRTRLALIDHVTSQTGLVAPLEQIVPALEGAGVAVLVDGAHAPGMLPLDVTKIGASFYTGNCHKWIGAPKGAAFLHVRPEWQGLIRPLVISHGANSPRLDRSRFLIEFGWTGTGDPSAFLSIPTALEFFEKNVPGGWPALMERNARLARAARALLCRALRIEAPAPESMLGSLASVPLPDGEASGPPASPLYMDPLQEEFRRKHAVEVPIIPWPAPPKRLLRVSAQLYNSLPQFERLAALLENELARRAG